MPSYCIAGLRLDAGRCLPGLPLARAGADPADLQLNITDVPAMLAQPHVRSAIWELNDYQFLLRLPDGSRLLARDGQELRVQAGPGVAVDDVLPLACSTGLAALLYQRGQFQLHAAAVVRDGVAWLLCGPGGAGKSTLAAALVEAGDAFGGDDRLVLQLSDDGRVQMWPDVTHWQLQSPSVNALGLQQACTGEVRGGSRLFRVEPPRVVVGPVPVAGLIRLEAVAADGAPCVTPVVDGATLLLHARYRVRLALALCRAAAQQEVVEALARRLPCFILACPRDLERLPEVVQQVRDFMALAGGAS